MAAPARTGPEILNLIHASPVGTSQGGWTLTSRTATPSGRCQNWSIVVTGTGGRVFTAEYTEQADGTLGALRGITDEDGVRYRWNTGTGVWFRTDGA